MKMILGDARKSQKKIAEKNIICIHSLKGNMMRNDKIFNFISVFVKHCGCFCCLNDFTQTPHDYYQFPIQEYYKAMFLGSNFRLS